jgi:hypothetical protein
MLASDFLQLQGSHPQRLTCAAAHMLMFEIYAYEEAVPFTTVAAGEPLGMTVSAEGALGVDVW